MQVTERGEQQRHRRSISKPNVWSLGIESRLRFYMTLEPQSQDFSCYPLFYVSYARTYNGIKSDSETILRRFRNQISAIPQPKSDTLPQPKKGASATKKESIPQPKKRRFRNQKKAIPQPKKGASATKKKTIPQPKKGDSATKTRGFRNQKKAIPQPPSAWLRNHHPRHNCSHSQHSIVSKCRGGWGGVGWGGVG